MPSLPLTLSPPHLLVFLLKTEKGKVLDVHYIKKKEKGNQRYDGSCHYMCHRFPRWTFNTLSAIHKSVCLLDMRVIVSTSTSLQPRALLIFHFYFEIESHFMTQICLAFVLQ